MQTCNCRGRLQAFTSGSQTFSRHKRQNLGRCLRTQAGEGRHYRTARRQRIEGQKDLKDLLIDPQYDALFDASGDTSTKDPFSSGQPSTRDEDTEGESYEDVEAYLERRDKELASIDLEQEDIEEDYEDEVANLSYIQILKKYQRHYFLQAQQDEIMTHHHRKRESEVPAYAQATVLAGLLEQYDNMDEYLSRHPQPEKGGNPWVNAWKMIEDPDQNLDQDPLPAWIRAKRAIVKNWDAIEELNGNRQQTIERISSFKEVPPERQHMLDTWDPRLYEGTPDVETPYEDYMDRFLAISEKTAELDEEGEADAEGSAFVDELLQMDLSEGSEE